MNSTLHGSFKFNKFYQRKFQHPHTHILVSERANTVSILQIKKRTQKSTAMAHPFCIRSRRDLFRWTPRCMVLSSSTNFIKENFNIYTPTSSDQKGRTPLVYLYIRKRTRKKSTGKNNQQGLETSYQITKQIEQHHAQESLTDLIQSSTKVNTDMHANN